MHDVKNWQSVNSTSETNTILHFTKSRKNSVLKIKDQKIAVNMRIRCEEALYRTVSCQIED